MADDDLVIIVPNDAAHGRREPAGARTRVLVGDRPIGLLQEFTLAVGVTYPARITAAFPEEVIQQSPGLTTCLVAYQTLLAPWTQVAPSGEPRTGPTLWERLEDD